MAMYRQEKSFFVKVPCPMCGHINTLWLDAKDRNSFRVVTCDTENGPGCDRYFAVQFHIKASAIVYNLVETAEATP